MRLKAIGTGPSGHTEATSSRLPADKRREQLIDVAADLFSRKGFNGATTREIAGAAGVTEAIIFRHFETKEQLYKAIVERSMNTDRAAEWLADLGTAMDQSDDEQVVRRLITAIISMHQTNPKFERLMQYAALEGNQVALLHVRQITADIVDRFKKYLNRRQQQGALRNVTPDTALAAIVGMAKHYAQCRYLYGFAGECISDDQAIDNFTAVALGGMFSPAASPLRSGTPKTS